MKPIILSFFLAFFVLRMDLSHASTSSDIVYVGDSHSCGCFGQNLDKSLRSLRNPVSQEPLRVQSIATCGSSTHSWLLPTGHTTSCGYRSCANDGNCHSSKDGRSDSLEQVLVDSGPRPRPKITVVALGSNMLKANLDATMKDVTTFIQKIKSAGSQCIWIGPPQAALSFMSKDSYERFVERLDAITTNSGCRFINSNEKTARENLKDPMGVHYSCDHGTAWSKKVFSELSPIATEMLKKSPHQEAHGITPSTN